jgi:hypothetical protein
MLVPDILHNMNKPPERSNPPRLGVKPVKPHSQIVCKWKKSTKQLKVKAIERRGGPRRNCYSKHNNKLSTPAVV